LIHICFLVTIRLGIESPVVVRLCFEIDTDGVIKNIKVIKGVHPIYDKEAVRLIRESPDWTPGEKNGEKVTTKIYYWIHFQRDKEYE
jgi:outer membrane biosynthesis protein TonB